MVDLRLGVSYYRGERHCASAYSDNTVNVHKELPLK